MPLVPYTKRIFFEPQNPGFIIESGFKSRTDYNGARMVLKDQLFYAIDRLETLQP